MTYRIGPLRLPILLAVLVASVTASAAARVGDLEPPGPPAPTMKTLDQVTPTWSRVLSFFDGNADGCNSSRFTCLPLLPNQTSRQQWVLDNSTGLVWEREPRSLSPGSSAENWADAAWLCAQGAGWRLASLSEITSLPATTRPTPFLLDSSPRRFWTMTRAAGDSDRAWTKRFNHAVSTATRRDRTEQHDFWCVRAPGPLSEY